MIKTLLVGTRDCARLTEIFNVASQFGPEVLLTRVGLERASTEGGITNKPPTVPRHTRLALEALGPTFVKLGQIFHLR